MSSGSRSSLLHPAAAALLALAAAACEQPSVEVAQPPVQVGVVEVQPRELPLALEYPAQLRGVREVEVRARVSGILLARLYHEGARVAAGDVLFRIDPDPFLAAAAQARAELAVRQANFAQTRRERDRIIPLHEQNLASLRDRDSAIAAFEAAEAAVAAAEAALRRAELEVSYTEVRAPIDGLTSREVRSEGSLVTAGDDSSLLAYIVQTARLYVEFAVSDVDAEILRTALDRDPAGVTVRVLDAQGATLGAHAPIEFVAPRVDDETGTIGVRAVLDNKTGVLPGRIVRVRVEGVTAPESLVIPKRAVVHTAQGALVWRVGDGEQVQSAPVTLGALSGNDVAVMTGLSPGDRIVVDGILKVQPGAVVAAAPIVEAAAAAPTGAGGRP